MELYQIRTFIAVAKSGGLTRAAGMIHMSRSALSSQIKALEGELGLPLFTRNAKGMTLTEEGGPLLTKAREVIRAAEQMEQTAGRLVAEPVFKLNVGINTDPVFLDIAGITSVMSTAMPPVSLNFVETQTFETMELLTNEKIDVGFHFGNLPDPSVSSQMLRETVICVVIPARFAPGNENASLKKIASLPWVWTKHQCPFHTAFEKKLDREGLVLKPVTEAVDENIVRELVKSGTGTALMRQDDAQTLVKEKSAVIWEKDNITLPLSIACLETRKKEKNIACCLEKISWKYDQL